MAFKLEDLKMRLLISLTISILLGCLVYFSDILAVGIALTVAYSVVVCLALWEFYHMAQQKGGKAQYGIAFCGALIFLVATYLTHFDSKWQIVPPVVIGVILFALLLQHFFCPNEPISSVAITLMGIMYVVVPLSFLLKINFIPSTVGISGQWWAMLLVFATKFGDVGAYFFGKMLGRNFLAPKISPKKSLEGLIGGLCFSVGISFAVIYLSPRAMVVLKTPWLYALLLGVSLSLIGLLGDLAESLLKRDAGVKDSNKLKGIGGMLDMMDSLIFTGPVYFLFLVFGNLI